jgi:hypothetical protein
MSVFEIKKTKKTIKSMYFYFSLDRIPYIYMQFTLIVEVFYILALILLLNP